MQKRRLEEQGAVRHVEDIERFIADWEPRFAELDFQTIVQLYLKRERPVAADAWVTRMEAAPDMGAGLVRAALRLAVDEALGRDTSEHATFWDTPSAASSWGDWKNIGDILAAMGRPALALRAYERALGYVDAQVHEIKLGLARVYVALCEPDLAAASLEDYLRVLPDDLAANRMAFRSALLAGDFATAEEHLTTLSNQRGLTASWKLKWEQELLEAQDRGDEARALLQRYLAAHPDDPEVVSWCAYLVYDEGALAARYHVAHRNAGNVVEAEGFRAEAEGTLAHAAELYERLEDLDSDVATALIGLSGVRQMLALVEPGRADEHLAAATEYGRRGVDVDDTFFHVHYNLGAALRSRALAKTDGDPTTLPREALETIAEHYRRSVSLNGQNLRTLNDTADVLQLLYRHTGDRAQLDEAFALLERAIRIKTAAVVDACAESTEVTTRAKTKQDYRDLSFLYDTQRDLYELAQDLPAALRAARLSLEAMQKGPRDEARVADRLAKVERLEDAVGESGEEDRTQDVERVQDAVDETDRADLHDS